MIYWLSHTIVIYVPIFKNKKIIVASEYDETSTILKIIRQDRIQTVPRFFTGRRMAIRVDTQSG